MPWKRISPLNVPKRLSPERPPTRAQPVDGGGAIATVMERIGGMVQACATDSPPFPPTVVYNETWLLRLVLDWFSSYVVAEHPLAVPEGGRWYSEALLPTTFSGGGSRVTRLVESATHADAVIGHFDIGRKGKADLSLRADATHLVVVEAKMFSGLSAGVTNAKYFDQAARTVACIAEALCAARRQPAEMSRLALYVVAPQAQIARRVFEKGMSRSSIARKVKRRVTDFGGKKEQWYSEWFRPAFQHMEIGTLSWEELLRTIKEQDPVSEEAIRWFYEQCVGFTEQPGEASVKRDESEE